MIIIIDSRLSDQKKRRDLGTRMDCGGTMAYRDEKSFRHVAMAAQFLDIINKPFSGKYGRRD